MTSDKKNEYYQEIEFLKSLIDDTRENIDKRIQSLNQSSSLNVIITELYNDYLENTILTAQSAMRLCNKIVGSYTVSNDPFGNCKIDSAKEILIYTGEKVAFLDIVLTIIEHLKLERDVGP